MDTENITISHDSISITLSAEQWVNIYNEWCFKSELYNAIADNEDLGAIEKLHDTADVRWEIRYQKETEEGQEPFYAVSCFLYDRVLVGIGGTMKEAIEDLS